jgi:Sec-independent protein translocase protein TatA
MTRSEPISLDLKASKAFEELRLVIREAHGAIRDLERLIKEVKGVTKEVENKVTSQFEMHMSKEVQEGLANYAESLRQATDNAVKHVFEEFDELCSILMGTEGVGSDDPNLLEMAKMAAEAGLTLEDLRQAKRRQRFEERRNDNGT